MKWCWWGLQLDNGKNLGLFFLQDMRTGETVQQGLTLHHADGTTDVCRSLEFISSLSHVQLLIRLMASTRMRYLHI